MVPWYNRLRMADQPTFSTENPVVFRLKIPWTTVTAAYEKQLDRAVEQAEIKGFRKGKAPRKLVQERVGKQHLYNDVVQVVLPEGYQQEIARRKITPYIAPRVKPLASEEGKDWEFEITVITRPKVSLHNYEEKIKDALAAGTIIKPGEAEKSPEVKQNEKLAKVFDALLAHSAVELPTLLVEEEVNMRLAKLVDQLQTAGLTVQQYLAAKKLTQQTLRQEYEKTARELLHLNLALDAIANARGLTGKDRISKVVESLLSL